MGGVDKVAAIRVDDVERYATPVVGWNLCSIGIQQLLGDRDIALEASKHRSVALLAID